MATDYVVDTATDTTVADGSISLREAVMAASTNTAVGDAAAGEMDGDTITFDPTMFAIASTITLTGGELSITDDLSIDGTLDGGIGALSITIDANNASRVFNINAPAGTGTMNAVALANLTATNGLAADNGGAILVAAGSTVTADNVDISNSVASGAAATNGGGAIFNAGTLTLTDGTISGSSAVVTSGSGGGIFNDSTGTLTATGTAFNSNSAARAGGGIETRGAVTLTNVSFDGNAAGPMPGNGGALHVTGSANVDVTGGTVQNNTAASEGGGFWNNLGTMTISGTTITANTASGAAADNGGGGLFNNGGTLTLTNVMVTNNVADGAAGSGGGILNAKVLDGSMMVTNAGTLNVTGGAITGNSAVRAGGGIEDESGGTSTVTIVGANISTNTAGPTPGNGGGLHVTGNGIVAIKGGMVNGNTASAEGGGLWNGSGTMTVGGANAADAITIDGNTASGAAADNGGGGLFNSGGTLVLAGNVTVSNNDADGAAGSGGGILTDGGSLSVTGGTITANSAVRAGGGIESANGSTLTLTDLTLSQNTAGANPGNGGAVHISGSADATITNAMVTGNTAAREGGGLWNGSGTMTISGSTIDGNTASGAAADDGGGGIFNNGGSVVVTGSSNITNNIADGAAGSGGGVFNLGVGTAIANFSMTGGTINGNTSVRAGGGIEDKSNGDGAAGTTIALNQVTLDGNSTGGAPGNGGAMHITGANTTATINRSTVSNNTAAKEGGGLWVFSGASMTVVNSTVSGNESTGTPGGGGLFAQATANLTLLSSTVANNSASATGAFGGGLFVTDGGLVSANSTLFSGNTAETDNDVSGALTANFSLIQDAGAATVTGSNNVSGMDPLLADLGSNGGGTQTHALMTGSPALAAGDDTSCQGTDVNGIDQRGVDRDSPCDIGAYEVSTGTPVATTMNRSVASVTAAPGATDVPAVAFTLGNTASEPISVSSFNGTIALGGNATVADIAMAHVYLDSNANGMLDSNETTEIGTVALGSGNATFTASFSPARVIGVGASETYLVTVDLAGGASAKAAPLMFAGLGGLGLLPLIGFVGLGSGRRRWLTAALVIGAGLALSACHEDDAPFTPPAADTVQFSVTAITASGNNSGTTVMGSGLPAAGTTITISR